MSTTSTTSRQIRKGGPGDPDDDGKPGPNRIICSLQSTGRIGKSTVAQALISWFGFAGVEFAAIDADGEHQTLSRWYPDIVTRLPFREADDLLPVLKRRNPTPKIDPLKRSKIWGAAEPRYVLQSPGLVENCVGLYVPLLEFNQR